MGKKSNKQKGRSQSETTEERLSAAEKMQLFKQEMRKESSGLEEFYSELSFTPDLFQREALSSLVTYDPDGPAGAVLVCAPTGAGKTVVGEGAVYLAVRGGERAFYTTPIKALSNQKYRDFCDRFGKDQVGLLTGDSSINPQAPVVVMTTEVLRNMLYAGSDLTDLQVVILDEIHYLADHIRGPVWEEVLIQLPERIQVVALSATVSNYGEFGRWIAEVRGSCNVVTSSTRPVPLYQHMLVERHLYDLYSHEALVANSQSSGDKSTEITPPRLNPDLLQAVKDEHFRTSGREHWGRNRSDLPHRRRTPKKVSRPNVLRSLERHNLLPAIVFIFSRAACDQAVESIVRAGISLTTVEEQKAIRQVAEKVMLTIPVADHGILNLGEWVTALERGVASHHAGLLPILKETVESLFSDGLVKLVYATETLALGINMPARTVVIEALQKWNGSEHVRLSPGEYTQLTGRAGRRGIDVEGHAVVLQRDVVSPEEVAQLASGHSYPLKSAFYPNYNMVVNLLNHSSIPAVRQVLESSFAQFQADDSVVELAGNLRRAEAKLAELSLQVDCSAGNAQEYFGLREDLSQLQKRMAQVVRREDREAVIRGLRQLKVGQIIQYRKGRRQRTAAVIVGPDKSWGSPLVKVIAEDAKVYTLGPHEINRGPVVLGHARIPSGGARRPRDRQAVAKQLKGFGKAKELFASSSLEVTKLQQSERDLEDLIKQHPVHGCPDRERHATIGHEWVRTRRECDKLAQQINSRTSSIARDFDRVSQVLNRMNYLDQGKVTDKGQQLRRVFGERDLLIAECVCRGVFDNLGPEELAAVISALVYEPRGDTPTTQYTGGPGTEKLSDAWNEIWRAYTQIHKEEIKAQVDRTKPPCPELIELTNLWAKGSTLSAILSDSELSGGDFVRWMRQVIDLLEQMRHLGDDSFKTLVKTAVNKIRRGVVAWT